MLDSHLTLARNLNDAGCDQTTRETFLKFFSLGKSNEGKGIHLLRQHRRNLLDDIHKNQKKVDALDFLIFKIQQENHDSARWLIKDPLPAPAYPYFIS